MMRPSVCPSSGPVSVLSLSSTTPPPPSSLRTCCFGTGPKLKIPQPSHPHPAARPALTFPRHAAHATAFPRKTFFPHANEDTCPVRLLHPPFTLNRARKHTKVAQDWHPEAFSTSFLVSHSGRQRRSHSGAGARVENRARRRPPPAPAQPQPRRPSSRNRPNEHVPANPLTIPPPHAPSLKSLGSRRHRTKLVGGRCDRADYPVH